MERSLVTRMQIAKPAQAVFEAFVDPSKIGNFWFSSSSIRWAAGATVTMAYVEFQAEVVIRVTQIEPNQRIIFLWGENGADRTVDIQLEESSTRETLVTVCETGWVENDTLTDNLIGNKEGWVFMLTCLKAYLENGITTLRTGILPNGSEE